MKSILIITNLEYASPRMIGLIKNIKKFSYKPIILCPKLQESFINRYGKLDNVIIYETDKFFNPLESIIEKRKKDSMDIKKNINRKQKSFIDKFTFQILKSGFMFLSSFINYPDSHIFWKKKALQKAENIIINHNIKLILSSSSPVSSHIIASIISKENNIKWIADLRDLWTQNHAYPYNFIRKFLEVILEKKTFKNVSAITTVSYPLINELKNLHKNKNIFEVTNGFFDKNVNLKKKNNNVFIISYTGQIYHKFQNIKIILKSIANLLNKNKINKDTFVFNFYGPEYIEFDIEVKKNHLNDICKYVGAVSWEKTRNIQQNSDLLLLLNWEDKNQKGVYFTKSFEYLSAKTPFIATGGFGGDVIEDLLKKTKGGDYCKSVTETEIVLLKYFNEWKNNGFIKYRGIKSEIEKFNYKNTTKKFVEIFDKVLLK